MAQQPPKRRILIVDDHAPTRAMIRAVLESEKSATFDVAEAGNGADCLKTFDGKGPFDLVLLDVNLPDMDGYEVCRAIRRVDGQIPIVFVTGHGQLKDFSAGRQAGGDSYIVKPVNRASLRSTALLFTNMKRQPRAAAPDPEKAKA
jgi:two-component system response regulator MtrA